MVKFKEDENETWFFREGYKTMDKLEQVDYLVTECGWDEDSAMELIYGTCDDE